MKNEYIEDVINFVKENSELFYNHINKLEHYPYVCDISSLTLGAYLKYRYSEIKKDIKIIDGFYGDNLERHWWIDIGEYKIDFTIVQFYQKEFLENKFNCKSKNLYLIDKYNYSNLYKNYDYDSYSVDDGICEYLNIAKSSRSFNHYLEEVFSGLKNDK